MEIIQLIGAYTVWCLIATGLGWLEAQWYHNMYYPNNPHEPYCRYNMKLDEHIYLTIIRIFIAAGILAYPSIQLLFSFTWEMCIVFALQSLSFILAFPYFHDGMLYREWNGLNPTVWKDGWYSYDDTPTAKFNFTYKARLIMFIVSIIFLIIEILCLL